MSRPNISLWNCYIRMISFGLHSQASFNTGSADAV
jgi:hypothetical protein